MNKEIMELIQPYMDKTLSEGCWITWPDWWYGKVIWNTSTVWYIVGKEIMDMNPVQYKENEIEEIWHYDITAVLKYIIENIDEENTLPEQITKDEIVFSEINVDEKQEECYIIPNKPLHLYSESENKDLLNLLLKFKDA